MTAKSGPRVRIPVPPPIFNFCVFGVFSLFSLIEFILFVIIILKVEVVNTAIAYYQIIEIMARIISEKI